jgi:NAD(P)-dependent dehydrogenase (short-subunit alcohol dehydrogenase family)
MPAADAGSGRVPATPTYPELRDAVVLITGAGRGIGRGIALAFGRQRATVIVNDLDSDTAAGTVDEIRADGGEAAAILADVGDPDAARAMVADVLDRHGRLDVLVANAGINPTASLLDLSQETWERVQHTNAWSLFHCGQPAARHMAARGRGSIVVIGSPAASETYAHQAHYATAKAALQMLAWGMAWELGAAGVRTNVVHPGWIETELNREFLWSDPGLRERVVRQIPLGRTGLPEDVADVVVWLCTDGARYVNGASLAVDGGLVVGRLKA